MPKQDLIPKQDDIAAEIRRVLDEHARHIKELLATQQAVHAMPAAWTPAPPPSGNGPYFLQRRAAL